jgi:WD40 repeat protein
VVKVLPRKPGPKAEPVASSLAASLMHPDRRAVHWVVRFSPDGDRLFTEGGLPAGVVQLWDVRSRKEIRRIEMPPRNARAILLTPDWKSLYVPVQDRQVKPVEQNGKKRRQIQYAGQVRVWDIASGKERKPLPVETGWGPAYGQIDPSGRYLVCAEEESFFVQSSAAAKLRTEVWELATGKKSELCRDYACHTVLPDGETVMVGELYGTRVLKLLQLSTGKELAVLKRDRYFDVGNVAPDGSMVALSLAVKKGEPLEVLFLDARQLQERGKLVGKPATDHRAWSGGRFTPDGKRFIILDNAGNLLVWDVAGQRLERSFPLSDRAVQVPDQRTSWCRQSLAVSPDSKTVAVGWTPKWDQDAGETAPDPQDVPQPRVSLISLDGTAAPRVLIAPPGYVGALAFSPDGMLLAFGGAGAVHLFDLTK